MKLSKFELSLVHESDIGQIRVNPCEFELFLVQGSNLWVIKNQLRKIGSKFDDFKLVSDLECLFQ